MYYVHVFVWHVERSDWLNRGSKQLLIIATVMKSGLSVRWWYDGTRSSKLGGVILCNDRVIVCLSVGAFFR